MATLVINQVFMDENTIPEPTLEESLQLLIRQVPVQVRDFILNELQGKTDELMRRYQLHIDQGGVLERELLLMLLGQEQPVDFMAALQGAGIAAETVSSLTTDINQEVFVKLRQAEVSAATAIQPVSTPVSAPTPIISTPVAPVTTPVQAQAPLPAATPTPVPTPTPAPAVVPTFTPVAPISSIPTSMPTPQPRTMMQDMKEAKEHPAPRPAAPSENKEALHNILKEYGVDPYREPAE